MCKRTIYSDNNYLGLISYGALAQAHFPIIMFMDMLAVGIQITTFKIKTNQVLFLSEVNAHILPRLHGAKLSRSRLDRVWVKKYCPDLNDFN